MKTKLMQLADKYAEALELWRNPRSAEDDRAALESEVDRVTAERDALAAELKSLRDSGVELPEPGREFFCTKCGSTECKDGAIQHDFPPCDKCGYLGFARGINFTEAQLRDYGDRRAMAERERAAKVCEDHATKYLNRDVRNQHSHGAGLGASICADAIRKGEKL